MSSPPTRAARFAPKASLHPFPHVLPQTSEPTFGGWLLGSGGSGKPTVELDGTLHAAM